jgi:inosine-uridine nucleoside N-ribohydrolase
LFVAFALLVPLPSSLQAAAAEKIPVVLSTDVGNEVDDQWTIAYLLLSDEFDVLGIVSAHAPSISPPAGQTSYRILRDVVENRLGMKSHPPLYAGADLPLQDRNTPRTSEGVSFIIEVSKGFSSDRRLNLVTIGAVTDAASAILEDPSIVERIRIVDMGFKSWTETPQGQEFNIQNDPKAAQVVLDSGVPFVVGAGDVCRQNLDLSLDEARQMMSERGPIGRWLWDEFLAWYYRFIKPLRQDDFSRPWIIWDNITLAYLLGMTEQETHSRPRMNDDLIFEHPATSQEIIWITDVDEERMWADFLQKLDFYQRTNSVGETPTVGNTAGLPGLRW